MDGEKKNTQHPIKMDKKLKENHTQNAERAASQKSGPLMSARVPTGRLPIRLDQSAVRAEIKKEPGVLKLNAINIVMTTRHDRRRSLTIFSYNSRLSASPNAIQSIRTAVIVVFRYNGFISAVRKCSSRVLMLEHS